MSATFESEAAELLRAHRIVGHTHAGEPICRCQLLCENEDAHGQHVASLLAALCREAALLAQAEARKRAAVAAALHEAAKTICQFCAEGIPLDDAGHEGERHCYAWAINALIPAEAQGAPEASRSHHSKHEGNIIHYKGFRYERLLPPTIKPGEAQPYVGPEVYDEITIESRVSERTKRLREALEATIKALHRELEYGLTHWENCNPTYPACSCGASQARAYAIATLEATRRVLESEDRK